MSQHHRNSKWASHAAKARKAIKAQLPLPCWHCHGMVTDQDTWDVAHTTDLAMGGDTNSYTAAHRHCNRSDGGRQGAAKTNARRKNTRTW